MLQVKDLHVNYGAVHALNGISLHVDDGEIVSLIGANGAGKTTTLRTITGLEKAASGSVMFDGHDLRKAEPSKIITYKLAHVPEGRHIFPQMTVEENLEMGAYADPAGMEETMKDVYKRFPRLEERRRQLAVVPARQQRRAVVDPVQHHVGPQQLGGRLVLAARAGAAGAQQALDITGDQVDLHGNVRIQRAASAKDQELSAYMPQLTVLPDDEKAFTEHPVRITRGDASWVTGTGMKVDYQARTYVLESQARAILESRYAKKTTP